MRGKGGAGLCWVAGRVDGGGSLGVHVLSSWGWECGGGVGGEACSAGQGFLLQGCGGEGAVGWQSRHLGFECWARAWAGVSRSW